MHIIKMLKDDLRILFFWSTRALGLGLVILQIICIFELDNFKFNKKFKFLGLDLTLH
jgi:hypothetical protein